MLDLSYLWALLEGRGLLALMLTACGCCQYEKLFICFAASVFS